MSDQLHPTRLEWDGRRGLARHDGVEMVLHRSPTAYAEVHFTPGIQAEVRERAADAKREMTADEIRQAVSHLEHFAARCREAIGQRVWL